MANLLHFPGQKSLLPWGGITYRRLNGGLAQVSLPEQVGLTS